MLILFIIYCHHLLTFSFILSLSPQQLHTCVWKVHSLFRINLVKGNKVNADDAAKVNSVNTSEFSMISLTLTFICLLLAQNQYCITIKTGCSVFAPFQSNDYFQIPNIQKQTIRESKG